MAGWLQIWESRQQPTTNAQSPTQQAARVTGAYSLRLTRETGCGKLQWPNMYSRRGIIHEETKRGFGRSIDRRIDWINSYRVWTRAVPLFFEIIRPHLRGINVDPLATGTRTRKRERFGGYQARMVCI